MGSTHSIHTYMLSHFEFLFHPFSCSSSFFPFEAAVLKWERNCLVQTNVSNKRHHQEATGHSSLFFFAFSNPKNSFIFQFSHHASGQGNSKTCVASAFQLCSISSAILFASIDAPSKPRFVNPTAYSPFSPFHPFGNGFRGNPSFSLNMSLPCSQ